jgi:hypothetical protein
MNGLSLRKLLPTLSWFSKSAWQNKMNEIRRKDIIDLEEAAFYLSFEPKVIAEEARSGHLPAGKIGGQWRFNRWALIEYFAISHNHETRNSTIFSDPGVVLQFLKDVTGGKKIFDSINLCGANLSGKDLSKIVLKNVNLSYADLSEANLQEAELPYSCLFKADLKGADLTYAELECADLCEANLSNATLVGTNLEGANLRGVDISGAKFHNVIF